jgi:copper resistance protein D
MSALAVLTRALHEGSVMTLFGSGCLLTLLASHVPELGFEGTGLTRVRRFASLLALASAPAWAIGMTGPLWPANTLPAGVLLARLVLLVLLATAVWIGKTRDATWLAGAALALIAATSHAAMASPKGAAFIGAVNDAVHLLTAGYWIGGLWVVLTLLANRPSAPRLRQGVMIFADWGMVTVALLVMTGIINAAVVLLGGKGHAAPTYVIVLALKVILAFVMIGMALIHHFRFLPRLGRAEIAAHLKERVGWELGLGMAIVGLAALLTQLSPSHQ